MNFEWAIAFVWRASKAATIINLVFVVLQGLLPLIPLYITKLIIDTISAGVSSSGKSVLLSQLFLLIVALGLVALANTIIGSISTVAREWQSQKVSDNMNELIHAKSVEVDFEYYENAQFHNTLHRAQQEAAYRPVQALNNLLSIGRNCISLIALAGLLFSFHWAISGILFTAVIPGFLVKLRYSGKFFELQKKQTSAEREAGYINWMIICASHAKEIRLFELGNLFISRFRNIRKKLRKEKLDISIKKSIEETIANGISNASIYACYGFIAFKAIQGIISMGALVMYFQAFQRGQSFLSELLGSFAKLIEDNLFISNLRKFLDLEHKIAEPKDGKTIAFPLKSGIKFHNVTFHYPGSSRHALQNINISIEQGETIALVGANGSGKTSLIKLLCRLYDPASGNVTIDGIDLRHFKLKPLRRDITVIFQDYIQYNLTVRENIWFGNVHHPNGNDRIKFAAQNSNADGVINSLSKGYETILGKLFETGEELSIGEWQKIALARAFMSDAQIIILDEPTSSLDAKAEFSVFNNFRKLAKDRTSILISHRFSTVRMADRIYVLDNGRIIEGGTHNELMSRAGTYANMFETQAQYYR